MTQFQGGTQSIPRKLVYLDSSHKYHVTTTSNCAELSKGQLLYICFNNVLQCFRETLSLGLICQILSGTTPKNILIIHKIAYPKVYQASFPKPKKCLTPPSLTMGSPPWGTLTLAVVNTGSWVSKTPQFFQLTNQRAGFSNNDI